MKEEYGGGAKDEEGISEVGIGKGYICFLSTYLAFIVVGSYISGVRGETGQH